jgi:hypothetical protein
MKLINPLRVYLPDTRNVSVERYGLGNLKLGMSVFTYSQLPGRDEGTCPGSTDECERVCYAKRITGEVSDIHARNTRATDVPPIPDECTLLRLHVSGDFHTKEYIAAWTQRLMERSDVTAWVYTRSWRVPELLPALEELRALPNVQMFASMDVTTKELPPTGWRRAWLNVDRRAAWVDRDGETHNAITFDGTPSYTCPEETGRKQTCEECRYCFDGKMNDVTFLLH